MIDALDKYDTTGMSEQDTADIEAIEAMRFVVFRPVPGGRDNNPPPLYRAERGGLNVVSHAAHSLSGLRRAIENDLARRGEPKPVGIVSGGVVGAAATTNQTGASS